jgi:phosphoribosylglycinamide formyltransferase-1
MRTLGPRFIQAFEHQILNIHPSLLPAYKGLNTHQRALDNAEDRHGVSIHLVTPELDDGPVIVQGGYRIEAGDRVEDLQRKGHKLEHQMYPQVLRWLSDKNLTIKGGQIFYDQALLEKPIQFAS